MYPKALKSLQQERPPLLWPVPEHPKPQNHGPILVALGWGGGGGGGGLLVAGLLRHPSLGAAVAGCHFLFWGFGILGFAVYG